MICTTTETLISLRNIPSYLAKIGGKKVHIATVYRWVKTGIAGVQLETIHIGGTPYSSLEAMNRFVQDSSKAKRKRNKDVIAEAKNLKQRQIEKEAKRLGI